MTQNIIGTSNPEAQFLHLSKLNWQWNKIQKEEFQSRIDKACKLMKQHDMKAVYLHAGTNLYYFTGMKWGSSERMVGALLTADGDLHFIAPQFEYGTVREYMLIEGQMHCWQEHESPYELFATILKVEDIDESKIGLDESCPFFITDGLTQSNPLVNFCNAKAITAGCRMYKSANEISIMQTAMDMTMEVQKSAARILRTGISVREMTAFIDEAHKACGAASGSYFCIVLFGVDSSFPHGVRQPHDLQENDVVLIDTGCQLNGYISDITRSYVYGAISDDVRSIWNIEKSLQLKAFSAAQIGLPCSGIDHSVRVLLSSNGLGPDYQMPGTPHRTGHGIGLDIHEWPYIVNNEDTLLATGMTFSIEPMICVPDQYGIRLEDHVYITEDGPQWFTNPAKSIDEPFG